MNSFLIDQLSFERDDVPLFENLSAHWSSGDIVQLIGPNGAGKTTLMRILSGLLLPTQGQLRWNDEALNSYAFASNLLYLGHEVGVKATLTPLENLQWYFSLHGPKKGADSEVSKEELERALHSVGLDLYKDTPSYQLSAGQRRRVALARLTISKAALWILDEPFTAIDKAGVEDLEQRIEAHAQNGGIVILSTHQAWKSENLKILDLNAYKPKHEYAHG